MLLIVENCCGLFSSLFVEFYFIRVNSHQKRGKICFVLSFNVSENLSFQHWLLFHNIAKSDEICIAMGSLVDTTSLWRIIWRSSNFCGTMTMKCGRKVIRYFCVFQVLLLFQYCQLLLFTSLVYVVVLVSILFDLLNSFSSWYSINLKYHNIR